MPEFNSKFELTTTEDNNNPIPLTNIKTYALPKIQSKIMH